MENPSKREQLIAEAILGAARIELNNRADFLGAALWSFKFVPRPGIGTVACDKGYRLYYDPAKVLEWGDDLEDLIGALAHEVEHPVRRHFDRAQALGITGGEEAKDFNAACDAELNDDHRKDGYKLPEGYGVYPETLEQRQWETAEFYYKAIRDKRAADEQDAADARQCDFGQSDLKSEDAPPSDKQDDPTKGKGEGDDEQDAGDDEDGAGGEPGDDEDAEGDEAGEGAGSGDGDEQDGESGDSGSSDAQDGAEGAEGDAQGEGEGGGQSADEASWQNPFDTSDEQGDKPKPQPNCGSAADGVNRDYEEPEDSEEFPAVPAGVAEIIEQTVAKAIEEASKTRGKVPGHWQAWAKDRADVPVKPLNWRQVLRRYVEVSCERQRGATDYTFNRPNRRAIASRSPIILPSLYDPKVQVAIQIDTSGSVSDAELTKALAEVETIIRTVNAVDKVNVITVDSRVQTRNKVTRASQVKLGGRGGTDMRVGIAELERANPRPAVIVVITDGETPWPAYKVKCPVIACLTRKPYGSMPPAWIKTVEMNDL